MQCRRPAMPRLCASMQCRRNAMPRLCVALRCFAHAPQINPAPFRCHPMLCIPFAWHCIAIPALRQALPSLTTCSSAQCLRSPNHRRRHALRRIARAVLGHTLPSPCFSPHRRRCALPRKAIAERCPALPSLICAHPRPCAALMRVALPTLSWSILRLDSAALGHASPGQRFASLRLRGATRSHSLPSHIRSKRSLANAQPREAPP